MANQMKISVLVDVLDHASATFKRIGAAVGGLSKPFQELQGRLHKTQEAFAQLHPHFEAHALGAAAAGAAAAAALKAPIEAFAELDDATARLRESFSVHGGGVQEGFDRLVLGARRLGNEYPTTTAAVKDLAAELGRLGVSAKDLAAGRLEAVLGLKIVMDPHGHQTDRDFAQQFVGVMHGAGIFDPAQMKEAANLIQKASMSSGMGMEDIFYAYKYMGSALETMGFTGLGNFKDILIQLGALHQGGSSGSHTGVGLKDMFMQGALIDEKLDKKKLEALRDLLESKNIHLDLFKADGSPAAFGEWITQIHKLDELNQKEALVAMHKLFGEQGGAMASLLDILEKRGITQQVRDRVDQQPELMERVNVLRATLTNLARAAAGTGTNLLASVGGSLEHDLKPATAALNDLGSSIDAVVKRHPLLVRGLLSGVGAFALWGLAVGAAGAAVWGLTALVGLLGVPVAAVAALIAGAVWVWFNWSSVCKWVGEALGVLGRYADRIAGGAVKWLTRQARALVQTLHDLRVAVAAGARAFEAFLERLVAPIGRFFGRIGAALAALPGRMAVGFGVAFGNAAQAIMTAWAPVKAFFKDLWESVEGAFKKALAAISPIVDRIVAVARRVLEIADWLGALAGQGAAGMPPDLGGGWGDEPAPAAPTPPTAPGRVAPPGSAIAPQAARANVSGTVRVTVEDQRTRVQAQPESPGVDWQVDTGPLFAGAH